MKMLIKKYAVLLVIMGLALTGMVYYGSRKEGYHVDEMYSYGLANSEYLPFMHFGESGYSVKDWMLQYGAGESLPQLFRNLAADYRILRDNDYHFRESVIYRDYLVAQENSADTRTTTWVSGQAYRDYLAVSESNTFNYASVYYNQRGDVHPPLFYLLLHTVCSVFQGSFSKWYALGINFVFLLGALALLYRTAERHFGGKPVALAAAAVYGLTAGILTTAMYLRMYGILTFMTLLFFYMHLEAAEQDFRIAGKLRVKLMAAAILGFLTHYYFVVYAIVTAAVFCVWMCVGKRWRDLLRYLLSMGGAAILGLAVWPFALRHVFSGYRGTEALGILRRREFYLIKVRLILQQIGQQILGGGWILILLAAAVLLALAFVRRREKGFAGKAMLLLVPGAAYIILVSQIVPLFVERYFMCMFPLCCLLVVYGVWSLCGAILDLRSLGNTKISGYRRQIRIAVLAASAFLLTAAGNGITHWPGYLYIGGQETASVPEEADCVYVLPDGSWNVSAVDSCILARCRRVGVVYESELECLAEDDDRREGQWVIVAVSDELDGEAVLQRVRETLSLEGAIERYREKGSTTTRIYLQVGDR